MTGSRLRAVVAPSALALAGLALALPIAHAGIREPRELEVAELSRRIAADLLGATSLRAPEDAPGAPTLGDLGSGGLPFLAIASAFRVFGLHPWAGRLAMCAFAVAGLGAVFGLLARFAGARSAALAALVLASTPLYAVHARTMLGDAASMGAFALALAGLGGLVLEDTTGRAARWAPLAVVGLVGGGLARGLLFGVAVPLVSVGAAALLVVGPLGRRQAQRRVLIGCCALSLGTASLVVFLRDVYGLRAEGSGVVTHATAVALVAPEATVTFETAARRLAHAMFPWSALVPLAVGRALASSPTGVQAPGAAAAAALRVVLLIAAGVALAASTLVAPWTRDAPFVGAAAVAALVALAFDDLAEGAPPSRIAAFATAVLVAILGVDLVREPDRALATLTGDGATFPQSLVDAQKRWVVGAALGVTVGAVVAASIGARTSAWRGCAAIVTVHRARLRRSTRRVGVAWGGNLAFSIVVVEAALVGLAAMVFLGRALSWASILRLPELYQRAFVHLFWVVPAAVVAFALLPSLAADLLRALAARARVPAPVFGATLAVVASLAFCTGFHPSLAAHLSPREALEAFATMHGGSEPLGLLGMSPRLVAYHGGGDVRAFARPDAAFGWLAGDEAPPAGERVRRWLVVPDTELAKLNELHRARFARNLPIADATSSRTLLAVSDLGGAPDRSPLRDVVLDELRAPARPVHATFGDDLEVVGWEVVDEDGALASTVATRTHAQARFFVRVLGPIEPTYAPFLHVDHGKVRFNGDRAFVDHGYGPEHWLVGDVVVLTCDLFLEAGFPIGEADVYFGFFSGATRMKVTAGPSSQGRAKLGKLRVR